MADLRVWLVGCGQRHRDGGAQRIPAAVADRSFGAELGQVLKGVQGGLPFRYGTLRQRGGVLDADRLEALDVARRHGLSELGSGLVVLRRAGAVAVSWRVDGDHGEAPTGHGFVGAGREAWRLLVQAATVTHQYQGRVIGAGYG